jgi:hypothetical protein
LTHEHQHVAQWHRGAASFVADYLTDRARRAALEAEALRCNMEIHYWATGVVLDSGRLAKKLVAYDLRPRDIEYAEQHLRLAAESVRRGGIVNDASKMAIRFFESRGHTGHVVLG